ncbi:MAG: ribonuclease [Oceanotoga sp.]|jgi:ribonuclease G|nr:ribonuclease [Oceanotoga sp.]MDO7977000.1 Rne/Rng family ribonuclease [Oceanotoga teriensis]
MIILNKAIGDIMDDYKRDKVMVFNDTGEEIRVALLENNILSEIFFEDIEADKNSGKIFIGRIENEVTGLEAFFVNIGMKKNGFLRFKDLVGLPNEYKRGDNVIVQVRKDGNSRKGPQLSMQINIPGNYTVYMPYGEGSIGISRKITEQSERDRIREIAEDIMYETEGLIFRTNCQGIDRETINEEVLKLRRIMHKILLDYKDSNKPGLLYSEEDFVDYVLRERLDSAVSRIVMDSKELYIKIRRKIDKIDFSPVLELKTKDSFNYYDIYLQINDIFARKIDLKSGGTITIDKTEAMTVIDIDSAGNIKGENIEETSFSTNMEAAREIMRQLRLRNIAGIIIVDFIDMYNEKHKQAIIELISYELRKDKARVTIVGFTELGLLELTRKRTSPSIDSLIYTPCPVCHGTGRVSAPSVVYNRMIQEVEDSLKELSEHDIKQVLVSIHHNLSGYVTPEIKAKLEEKTGTKIKFEFNWTDPNTYNIRYKK